SLLAPSAAARALHAFPTRRSSDLEIAAAAAGVELSLPPLLSAFGRLHADADSVVVEGVGGWLAPLSATLDQADLVHALQLPVVIDRKSTRLNSSHVKSSYAVFCLK